MKKKHHISLNELYGESEQRNNEDTPKTSFEIPSKEKVEHLKKSQAGIIQEKYQLDYSNTEPRTVMAFRIPKDSTFTLLGYLAEIEGKSNTEVANAILTYYFNSHEKTIRKDYEMFLKNKLNTL